MNEFERIEEKYGLVLPSAYRSMSAAGWFDLKSDNYFWLWETKWLSLEKILNYQPKEYHKPGFVPFAKTAGGDLWCWCPAEHSEAVVLCPHDCEEGTFFAPTFIGFIYRNLLDFTAEAPNPTDEGFDPECDPLPEQVLRDSAARLTHFFPDTWRETLEALASTPPTRLLHNGKDIGSAALTGVQYQTIVQRDLAFPLLDQKFEWMNSDEE